MASLTRFEELFGDESYNFVTTPALQDVVPGLVETDSKYAAKELNKGREAATGRSFRSPVPRSLPTNKVTVSNLPSVPLPVQERRQRQIQPTYPESDWDGGPGGGSRGGRGGQDDIRIRMQGETGRLGEGTLGNAIGDSLASSLGTTGLLGMISAGGAALSAGAPSSMLPSILGGSFVSSALNPVVLANILGGGVMAGQMGYNAGTNTGAPFTPDSPQSQAAQVAAFNAIDPGIGGALEMGTESILSALFGTENNTSKAANAAATGVNSAIANTNNQAAVEAMFAGDEGVSGTALTESAPPVGSYATGTVGSPALSALTGELDAPLGEDISGSTGILGDTGAVSQGLQALGFGGNVSGVQGVGPGGSTNATTGMQQGVFGEPGLNPHASEMNIAAAPSPTVGGVQGHGTGVTGQAPTGRGDSVGSGGFGGSYGGGGSMGAPTGETGEGLSGGGGAGK